MLVTNTSVKKTKIKLTQNQLLAIVIFIFAAAMYTQYAVINKLNADLAEKQRQVSGLKSYNQSLQHKMRRMINTGGAQEFYRQANSSEK